MVSNNSFPWPLTFKLLFKKGAGTFLLLQCLGLFNFHPQVQGKKKNTEGDHLGGEIDSTPAFPPLIWTHSDFLSCVQTYSLPPKYDFSSSNRSHLVMHKQISSWLIFTHRESGQASSYSSAPLPPLQDPPGSGPPAFLHIWAVSSWRLPSILGGLIFGTI